MRVFALHYIVVAAAQFPPGPALRHHIHMQKSIWLLRASGVRTDTTTTKQMVHQLPEAFPKALTVRQT